MLQSISKIKNLAVFKDFEWNSTVLDADGRTIFLKPLNIIYGRNYSGKTTLSRIIRSLKTGSISSKYGSPEYTVTLTDGTSVTHESPTDHAMEVRVFNEDFVRDHLRVFANDNENIAAFAVLGEDNAAIAGQLAKKEAELGSEYTPGSLRSQESECRKSVASTKLKNSDREDALNGLLTYKARIIKHNTRYADANYDIRKIRSDIKVVISHSYSQPSDETVTAHEATLLELPKSEVGVWAEPKLGWDTIVSAATELLGRAVRPTEPIQELLDEVILQTCVERGREYHEGKRAKCAFCGGVLPEELWGKLDKHFNKESKVLRKQLETLVDSINTELDGVSSLLPIDPDDFYSKFTREAQSLKEKITDTRARYTAVLTSVRSSAQERLTDIFSSKSIPDTEELADTFQSHWDEYEDLCKRTNAYTASLSSEHSKSRTALRLNEVAIYLEGIEYEKKLKQIAASEAEIKCEVQLHTEAHRKVQEVLGVIAELKSSMRDERNGAKKVNHYLNHDFGHQSLRLEAVAAEDGADAQYYFTIQRNGQDAYHLSEGERSLIAFCYFLARLDDVDSTGKPLIIWIDDPVSNLDDNHAFFVYSLIRTHVAEDPRCQQLFISTHSLPFLKYLYRLRGKRTYLYVERHGDTSDITEMPQYLRRFVTEFHHLFRQIYRCSKANPRATADESLFYSFPNNVRRFLEMYLTFKYPDHGETQLDKIERFFNHDAVSAIMADRVNNEYSHVQGLFERVSLPMDPPLMKDIASFIMDRLKVETEQYASLLKSIGVELEDDNDEGDEGVGATLEI